MKMFLFFLFVMSAHSFAHDVRSSDSSDITIVKGGGQGTIKDIRPVTQ
jgi:hypothetical protein